MKTRTKLLIGGGLLLVVIALIVARKKGAIGGSAGELEVTVEKASRRTIVESVSASGKIQPEIEVKIAPEVSGEIVELNVKEGDEVQAGQLLVRINPDIYEANVSRTTAAVNSARAAEKQARAQYEESKKVYDRQEGLLKKGAISQAEFDVALRTYEVAKLQVDAAGFQLRSAEASLKEARDNLNRTTIYAPADGHISKLNVEKGERVVGTATMAGTELLRLANLAEMEVLVDVNENDIIKVNRGDTALIEVDAYVGRKFTGVVTEVANSAKSTGVSSSVDQVTNFEVKVRILKSSYADLVTPQRANPFRPGMTAAVEVQTERKVNVLAVPIQAVTTRTDTLGKVSYGRSSASDMDEEEGTESKASEQPDVEFEVVFLEASGKAELKVVTTGIQDDKFIEVVTGLDPDANVITGPYSALSRQLKRGSPVSVTTGEKEEKRD
jgi:HlyD family secretion protein